MSSTLWMGCDTHHRDREATGPADSHGCWCCSSPLAACSDDSTGSTPNTTSTGSPVSADGPTTSAAPTDTTGATPAPLTWARANLGGVSAYVLARGTDVAIVDTGLAGSADDIGETLADIGLNYGNVTHLFLTHLHSDHTGSTGEVMGMATNAGLLVAGDAMVTTDGGVQGPAERFAKNLDQAHDSVRRLAGLSCNTLLVGHGDPIEDRADTAVAAMAAAL
jgi:glyoxylase-like metal-dependent hydrolase (beta-lactamase superfamily II)